MSEIYVENNSHDGRLLEKAAAWLAGSATTALLGISYIANHTAEGNEIVASTTIGEKTYGVDVSEVLVSSIALTATALCSVAAYNQIEDYINARRAEKDS